MQAHLQLAEASNEPHLVVRARAARAGDPPKTFATLQAEAALAGFSLTTSEHDDGLPAYYLSRWAYTRELRQLDAVAAVLRQIGGHHG
ncbi:MAG TPA: hypothetical protein VFR90_01455 [Methylibium sp.]|uniref:hypothetical protein n=1 Tax=Methylibium sp. TaxID=2067992 RepID=UPI002DBF842A|nr:hypothetical protein [Methylibium sp.]HEU4457772.1 hypothetical protein [Methylibium sp.]